MFSLSMTLVPLSLPLLLLLSMAAKEVVSEPISIVIGEGSDFEVGWSDGVCYLPVKASQGDELVFDFDLHNVFQLASRQHFDTCNFTDATLLADVGESPYTYTINTDTDTLYFACRVGSHCMYWQKVQVQLQIDDNRTDGPPGSQFILGASDEECAAIQSGNVTVDTDTDTDTHITIGSQCTEPELQEDGSYFVSCLSRPATLTPGGVMNQARLLHYPFPTDRRVVTGLRMWEFVSGDPETTGVTPVPLNQLYIHHLSGSVILGQGSEGVGQREPDAPFPSPYGRLTGDEGDFMVFHIIDLRGVDDWLPCVECRCRNGNGTYLDNIDTTGGVDCCTNCTSLTSPTIDYRMRYNVSYSEIEDPVTEVLMLTADISPAVGKNIEFDVPSYEYLLPEHQKSTDPQVQRLERVGPFNELFKHEFFSEDYHGPDTVKILRCVGHLHIASIGMWLEDAVTGETLCQGDTEYGTNAEADKGFLTAISVANFNPPKSIPADQPVRLVTEYNATILHTGVMGMWFLFISGERDITSSDTSLSVNVCLQPTCDASLFPVTPDASNTEAKECVDELVNLPACRFGNLCDCETFVNAAESTGCGGVFSTEMGDVPVNDACAKYCNACDTPPPASISSSCVDSLPESPACQFGNLCDCDALATVNPDDGSGGCGSVYSTSMGDIIIDEVCATTCNACPSDTTDDGNSELVKKIIMEQLEEHLFQTCEYATDECRLVLSNLYSCAKQQSGVDNMDPMLQSVVLEQGRRIALKHSKLGDSSLHRNEPEEVFILPCGTGTISDTPTDGDTMDDPNEPDDMSGSSSFSMVGLRGLFVVFIASAWMLAF